MTYPRLVGVEDNFDPRRTLEAPDLAAASRNGFPVVASRKAGRDGLGLLAGAGGAVLLGAVTLITLSNGRESRTRDEASRLNETAVRAAPRPSRSATPTTPAAITPPVRPEDAAPMPILQPSYEHTPMPASAPMRLQVLEPTSRSERDRSPALIFDTGDLPAAPDISPSDRPRPAGLSPDETIGLRVDAKDATVTEARRMRDPGLTVTQGTLIPAVLETAIDSDLPGYVRALVSQDVRSFDGTRVLIPRSSRLIGEYKSGLSSGQTRAYVIWSRLIRPDGASVSLASPAVDAQGRTGLAGEVDHHFLQRFGSSMLLSVIGAAGSLRNGGLVISSGESAAAVAARRDGQTPPTVRVRQGQPIRVFIAHDLSFAALDGGAP